MIDSSNLIDNYLNQSLIDLAYNDSTYKLYESYEERSLRIQAKYLA